MRGTLCSLMLDGCPNAKKLHVELVLNLVKDHAKIMVHISFGWDATFLF